MAGYDEFFATPPSRLDRPARSHAPWEVEPPGQPQPAPARTVTAAAPPRVAPSAVDLWDDGDPPLTVAPMEPPVVVAPRPRVAAPIVAREVPHRAATPVVAHQVPHPAAPPPPTPVARTVTTEPLPTVAPPPAPAPRPPSSAWPPPIPATGAAQRPTPSALGGTPSWTPPSPTGGWTPELADPTVAGWASPHTARPARASFGGASYAGIGAAAVALLRRIPTGLLIRLVITGVVVVGGAVTAWVSAADRDDTGAVVAAGEVAASDLVPGDCFEEPGGTEFSSVRAVPCAEPHDYEVFHLIDLPGDEYPDYEQVYVLAQGQCLPAFEAFVGIPWIESELDFMPLWPTPEAWEQGDRAAACAIFTMDRSRLTGSAAGTAR